MTIDGTCFISQLIPVKGAQYLIGYFFSFDSRLENLIMEALRKVACQHMEADVRDKQRAGEQPSRIIYKYVEPAGSKQTDEKTTKNQTVESDEAKSANKNVKSETSKENSTSAPTDSDNQAAEKEETVYSICTLNVRKGPGTDTDIIGTLKTGDSVIRVGIAQNGWSKIKYNDTYCYAADKYLSTEKVEKPSSLSDSIQYPLTYSDSSCTITINKEWYQNAYCYIAHVVISDYSRFATSCANGSYGGGYETTSNAADRVGAILCINGCYSAPYLDYGVVRNGVVCNDKACYVPAIYNGNTGVFSSPEAAGVAGSTLSSLAGSGTVKDTFCFGPAFLTNGTVSTGSDTSRAQRTFIGTNGKPGDFYFVVSEGRYVDGKSAGLTYTECANLLKGYGCTFGIPLDGGGSSTMVFKGTVLNHLPDEAERAVVDFVYIK